MFIVIDIIVIIMFIIIIINVIIVSKKAMDKAWEAPYDAGGTGRASCSATKTGKLGARREEGQSKLRLLRQRKRRRGGCCSADSY